MTSDSTEQPGQELILAQLAQIDGEIDALLRDGVLSTLNYDLAFPTGAKRDRSLNLKALLQARGHYYRFLNP